MKREPYTILHSLKRFRYWSATADDIDIEDIAHALSNICRFTGHVRKFYSVAEHSVILSKLVQPKNGLWALLHDAAEAYVNDLSHELKRTSGLTDYRILEYRLIKLVADKFGLHPICSAEVKAMDRHMAHEELRLLIDGNYAVGAGKDIGLGAWIKCLPPQKAKKEFLARFFTLMADRGDVNG